MLNFYYLKKVNICLTAIETYIVGPRATGWETLQYSQYRVGAIGLSKPATQSMPSADGAHGPIVEFPDCCQFTKSGRSRVEVLGCARLGRAANHEHVVTHNRRWRFYYYYYYYAHHVRRAGLQNDCCTVLAAVHSLSALALAQPPRFRHEHRQC